MNSMMRLSLQKRLLWLYPALMLLCGIGYAKYDAYQLDGDAISFMDISDAFRAHQWHVVANGYWNPAYAAALALGSSLTHTSRWNELHVFFFVNFFIYLGCIAATFFFVNGMVKMREVCLPQGNAGAALTPFALMLASLGLLLFSFQRELSLGKVRSDALLLFFLLLAAGFVLRLQAGGKFTNYPLLGVALGAAYLTKSFAFLPSCILVLAIFLVGLRRKNKTIAAGAILTGVLFAAVAGPYIYAISRQAGYLTVGDSARINYMYFIDHTPRWHSFRTGNVGHAIPTWKHHEELLLSSPPVYSYAGHAVGTYPLWFDPNYYTAGLKPHFWLHGHLRQLVRNPELLLRFLFEHPESFVLFFVLLGAGALLPRGRFAWLPWVPVMGWGLLMLGIYFPVDLQDRYLTAPFLLVVLPALALLRLPTDSGASMSIQKVATSLALLLAFLSLTAAARDIFDRRRTLNVAGYPQHAYSPDIYPAARGLIDMGIAPGDKVACMGGTACQVDQYWARLASAQILAEIEVPDSAEPDGNPEAYWNSLANHQQIVSTLAALQVKALVAAFPPSDQVPAGWHQLGQSHFYAYPVPH
jgi:4-amino-4-deoxy-L-arabinose transferase-like glycosyltransferase